MGITRNYFVTDDEDFERLSVAYEAATEAAVEAQPGLEPRRVLRAWDFGAGVLSLAGPYARRISDDAFLAGERAFFEILEERGVTCEKS